jgi:cytochrome c5
VSHEDDTFARTFIGVLIFLFVLMVILIIGANMIAGDNRTAADADTKAPESIMPVGKVKEPGTAPAVAETETAPAAATTEAASAQPAAVDGAQVYNMACMACHATGAAGAPKMGDKANWAPRISQGMDILLEHATKGFKGNSGYMPPKGGRADLSVAQIEAAIEHMVNNSK